MTLQTEGRGALFFSALRPPVKTGRRFQGEPAPVLPRGMNKEDVVALLRDGWELQESRSAATENLPAFVRRAKLTVYRLTRHTGARSSAMPADPNS